jgi:dipeptidyl aminopeptidase/acylaminoacyl peptidase
MTTRFSLSFFAVLALGLSVAAQVPENLVAEGIPPVAPELRTDVGRYLEFRGAMFQGWHPERREMLIGTRFADSLQLHQVKMPGGARRQLTFSPEPISAGTWQPKQGNYILFEQDAGGGEFYQFYRLDPGTGRISLLTDGKSRNGSPCFSRSGKQLAYTSTRRTGRDNDLYVMDPADPKTDKLACELAGGGWGVLDWSHDETKLLLIEMVSINQSRLSLFDFKNGTKTLLTPDEATPVAYAHAVFAKDDAAIFLAADKGSEFSRLMRLDLKTRELLPFGPAIAWDVEEFELSPDGKTLAVVTNEDGASHLALLDARTGKLRQSPKLPLGVLSKLAWHENSRDLGFSLSSARSPLDAYSLDAKTGEVTRWTESETGGMDIANFVEPELIRVKSFDGLTVSGFLYRPDPKKFPGKRPVIVSPHGGPEAQSRPMFQGRLNYYLNELGIAILYPNIRGSAGYGKTFLTLDNGFKREDSVRDMAAVFDWVGKDSALAADRIAVMGGSYGGYMTLACLTHYSDRLRCGVDIVGISNFISFLNNTQDYRRDLRRVEYGDERDPAMAAFQQKISPLTNVDKIGKPLFVVQGKNDPRVPVTEAEQMVKAIRTRGGAVWYLMAQDEGHGFKKKKNADFQFLATIQFFREHLLK